MRAIVRFLSDESGQAATEYILIIGLISIPVFIVFRQVVIRFVDVFIRSVIETFTRG